MGPEMALGALTFVVAACCFQVPSAASPLAAASLVALALHAASGRAPGNAASGERHDETIGPDAPDASDHELCGGDARFWAWLGRRVHSAELGALTLVAAHRAAHAWLSAYEPTAVGVAAGFGALLAERARAPRASLARVWAVGLLLAHAAEAAAVAFGARASALAIGAPRVAQREGTCAACLLLGLIHAVQPLSRRCRFGVALGVEALWLLWLLPWSRRESAGERWLTSADVADDAWVGLVVGCAANFGCGVLAAEFVTRRVLRPLWRQAEAAARAAERLEAEKERLLYDWRAAQDEVRRLREGAPPRRWLHRGASDSPSSGAYTHSDLEDSHANAADGGDGPRLYRLRAAYRNERARAPIEYLSTPAMRRAHTLGCDGETGALVDGDGALLNPAPQIREAIFVVSAEREVRFSFDLARHRHSSLVGGADVLAAGVLRVSRGLLLEADNYSPHYRPAAESLAVLAALLREMGARLDDATFQPCRLHEESSSEGSSMAAAPLPLDGASRALGDWLYTPARLVAWAPDECDC